MNNNMEFKTLLERLNALYRYEIRKFSMEYQLYPIHLEALTYLSQCNAFSNTAIGVQSFLCLTKGTASQSLNLLVKKRFLIKVPDQHDQRLQHLHLTISGQYVIAKMQQMPFQRTLNQLSQSLESAAFVPKLKTVLQAVQTQNRQTGFGICHTCRFHQPVDNAHFYCQLAQKTLQQSQARLLCKEHQPKK